MNVQNGANARATGLTPILKRLGLAAALAAIALFVFFKIAHEVSEPDTRQADMAVSHFFQARQTPTFHSVAQAFS